MEKSAKIYVAGGNGMVGSAILRALKAQGYTDLLHPGSSELNLIRQAEVEDFFRAEKPEYVFLAAAKVGGILANDRYPADFIYQNIMIESNVIHAAYEHGVRKLLFLGSSCIYPKFAEQPIREEALLSGYLEPTNEAYAIAKIAGVELCKFYKKQYGCDFISAMPTNLYGYNDNFDPETSHVLPALIRKFHEAKIAGHPSVTLWGTGTPKREFLFVDDLAQACLFLMQNYDGSSHLNVGTGEDVSITHLASIIQEIIGYEGEINYDTSKPDGTPRKVMDVSKINALGWKYTTELRAGIELVYDWYLKNIA